VASCSITLTALALAAAIAEEKIGEVENPRGAEATVIRTAEVIISAVATVLMG